MYAIRALARTGLGRSLDPHETGSVLTIAGRIPERGTVPSPAVAIVVQGRLRTQTAAGWRWVDSSHYTVMGSHTCFTTSRHDPVAPVAVLIPFDPALVRRLVRTAGSTEPGPRTRGDADADACPALDDELVDVLVRLLRAEHSASERRALAPIYTEELAYRLLQREHGPLLVESARREVARDRLSEVIRYVDDNLDRSLTVAALAARANLSPSALTAQFRAATGLAPYEFVKRMRLERASGVLLDGRHDVASVAREVGYSSVSHFISQFRAKYGETPRSFAASHALVPDTAVPDTPVPNADVPIATSSTPIPTPARGGQS